MEMNYAERLAKNITVSIAAKQVFLQRTDQHDVFQRAAEAVVQAYRRGGRLYIAGNGGFAADAQHFAAEFVSKLAGDRDPLPAEALTVDSSILTAIGNDYGYAEVFARQIAGKMRKEDVFLGITTSSNSPNILRAMEQCRSLGLTSIVFTGRGGGKVMALADYCIVVSGDDTATIQELHTVLAHTLCGCVESDLFHNIS
jgi:D-sedoheptulose 7-phosphate isomerase